MAAESMAVKYPGTETSSKRKDPYCENSVSVDWYKGLIMFVVYWFTVWKGNVLIKRNKSRAIRLYLFFVKTFTAKHVSRFTMLYPN